MPTETPILDEGAVSEIEDRVNAATPGPWEVYPDSRPDIMTAANVNSGYMGERHLFSMDKYGSPWGQDFENERDAEFIAHAREDIPALCATVKHLRAENERLAAEVQELAEQLIKSADRSGELLVANGELRSRVVHLCKQKAEEWTGESSFAAEELATELEKL